ncbi:Osmosensitive K+ channel histidine kinase [Desulfosporosinus sp. I2]|uniref:hypothetical protein n=1 Tax=Desulfosporosinus sp. I2 TaxID=1617025 RepID=UPI0005F0521F|nr:hypothetical protein [Desulfosporosinus sp. I2]KJR45714.1 Osmosensitive K+ channel histidine kinase [Desulfosporosinus sp. I2]
MPWIEIELSPRSDWNEDGLEDWAQALGAFLTDKGTGLNPQIHVLPGLNVLQLGEGGIGELTLSSAERLVILDGLSLKGTTECDFARFVVRFARQMGAVGVWASISSSDDKNFWRKLGGIIQPDSVPLVGPILRDKVAIRQLSKFSLLVTYEDKPTLCLEPITCNAHAPGLMSLSQRRLEKMYGGCPLGFASRVAVHCPWKLDQGQWDDLLSYSRLQAFDLLEELVGISQ